MAERRSAKWSSRSLLCLALFAVPPLLLTIAALSGLGLSRGAAAVPALVAALALGLLPVMGLNTLVGMGRPSPSLTLRVGSSWLWSILVLGFLPFYFPGERADAAAAGARLIAAPFGESWAVGAGEAAEQLVSILGRERPPLAPAPRMAARDTLPRGSRSEMRDDTAGAALAARASMNAPLAQEDRSDHQNVVLLPYQGDGNSLRVTVDFDGPEIGEEFDMIFDTGATYTTLSLSALAALDVEVPVGAPVAALVTANGRIEAPLVLLDAIWLGDEPVEWVTVALCDSCSNPPSEGLLGLNVANQFRVSLNQDQRRIELKPRHRNNRAMDVRWWLRIESKATQWSDGRIDLELVGRNHAQQAIATAVIEVACADERFAVQLDDIPPFGQVSTQLALPSGTNCREYTTELYSASWLLDRFE